RLLQEREYERLGENITRSCQVRVIAATNRDLKKRVAEGAFREDLYFRLNVISVEMPPLRTRSNDVLRLAEHFLHHFATQSGRSLNGFAPDASQGLLAYSWPGNLRELRNAIERAVILARGPEITLADLPREASCPPAAENGPVAAATAGQPPWALVSLEKLETQHIRRVLTQAKGLAEAAEILGIDQATLYRKRKKLGLE
ncbi:MAG TPA: sigma 54-interacting transcriptional regulator, partial [Verrucomicrobiae bacterium]